MSDTTGKPNSTRGSVAALAGDQREVVDSVASRETMTAVRVGLAHFIHEVANPLHMIYSTVGLIEQELPNANGHLGPFMRKSIPRLKNEIEQMIELVASLRTQLECIWSSNASYDAVELSALVDRALRSEAARLQANGVLVNYDGAPLPAIKGNEKLLAQALTNLIRNAADAMPQGGTLRISAVIDEDSVSLKIADTGVGLPANIDVFQPFATTKERGIGLGLSITRHVIEAHGGTIGYRSEAGTGTTFRLTLPLARSTALPASSRAKTGD